MKENGLLEIIAAHRTMTDLDEILKKDKYCDVCKMEMKAGALDDDDMEVFDELELCPVCHVNYINDGETMCASCLEESLAINKEDEDDDWHNYVDKEEDEEDDDLDLLPIGDSDEEIDEELEGTFAKDLDADFKDDFDDVDDLDSDLDDDFDDDLDLDDDLDDDEDDEDDFDDDEDEDDEFDD